MEADAVQGPFFFGGPPLADHGCRWLKKRRTLSGRAMPGRRAQSSESQTLGFLTSRELCSTSNRNPQDESNMLGCEAGEFGGVFLWCPFFVFLVPVFFVGWLVSARTVPLLKAVAGKMYDC